MIRLLIDRYTKALPAILEIPSKDHPYDANKDSILRRAKVSNWVKNSYIILCFNILVAYPGIFCKGCISSLSCPRACDCMAQPLIMFLLNRFWTINVGLIFCFYLCQEFISSIQLLFSQNFFSLDQFILYYLPKIRNWINEKNSLLK